jgi:hypothetical protein
VNLNVWACFQNGWVAQATGLYRQATRLTERRDAGMASNADVKTRMRLAIPVGGSPTGTGESPVLPILRHARRRERAQWRVFKTRTERGRPRPQQRTYNRQFSKMSNDLAIVKLLRPRTGALRFQFENTWLPTPQYFPIALRFTPVSNVRSPLTLGVPSARYAS